MSFSGGNSNAKSQGGNGALGFHQDAARAKVVFIPSGGSQGYVHTKDSHANSLLKAYGGNGGSGIRSSGQVQGNQNPSSSSPYGSMNARGATGYVPDGRIKTPTISRPSYAQGYTVRA